MKEGTSAVLLQSGLGDEWWADETLRTNFLMGRHHMKRRFGMLLNGAKIPFGAMVECHPISAKNNLDCISLEKILPGILLGYVFNAGGIWIGDIMIADIEDLEEMDASELHVRRLNAKEVSTSQRSGSFIFSVAVGTVRIFGVKQCLRTSTLTQDRPERGDEQEILRGKSDELHSPTPLQEDSTRHVEKANNDF